MASALHTHSNAASIRISSLYKRYDELEALRGISFDVEPGELFGIIGPDGAGKTTLLRILVTVIKPDEGQVIVDGLDVLESYKEIRQRIGYMPGRFSLYPDLTVKENLEFFASVFGTTIADEYELIAPIYSQIEPFATRRAGALSGGMKQKLALSCALIHRPRVLILDEPTTGVDAVSRLEFWDMLTELKKGGITTVVSTPYMDEATRCDRIVLMQEGRLLGTPDSPRSVAASLNVPLVRVQAQGSRPQLLAALRAIDGVARAEVFGTWIHVSGVETVQKQDMVLPSGSETDLVQLIRSELSGIGWSDIQVEATSPTVEDVFISHIASPLVK